MTLTLPRRASRAFTLIELIVAIVIMGILVAIGAFAYNRTIESAHKHSARMMANHFAKDASGIAAGKQTSVSALYEANDSSITVDLVDDKGSDIGVDWGTASPTGVRVVGVSYKGYCTPVLFPAAPGAAKVGTTVKTTTSCATENGVIPTGDPILNPAGGTGGDIGDPPGGGDSTGGYFAEADHSLDTVGSAAWYDVNSLTFPANGYYDDSAEAWDGDSGTIAVDGVLETAGASELTRALNDGDNTTGISFPTWDKNSSQIELYFGVNAAIDVVGTYPGGQKFIGSGTYETGHFQVVNQQVNVKVKFPKNMPTPLYTGVQISGGLSGEVAALPHGAGWAGHAPDANGWVTYTIPWTSTQPFFSVDFDMVFDTADTPPTGKISEIYIR